MPLPIAPPRPVTQIAEDSPVSSSPSFSLPVRPRAARNALIAILTASLAACGGGGGGGSSSAPAAAGAPSPTSSPAPTPAPTPAPPAPPITATDAARLASQATFGSNDATVAAIVNSTYASTWIDQQLATAPTGYPVLPAISSNSNIGCPTGSVATCYRDNYTPFPVQHVFLANAISGPDQLRQRVAFALSQIFVISALEVNQAYAMREYQQMLLNDSFGNFRTLMQDVTLSPAMGLYLNMVNNAKGNVSRNTHPNENYGRELMQLFTVGPNLLNQDGSFMKDSSGAPIPTYTQTQVEGYAAAFTGWTYPPMPGATSKFGNPQYFIGPMVAFDTQHDMTAKTLLNGVTTATGQTSAQDLATALDSIFNHPNLPPFISKQLIQFLVSSNPSPAYVSRIAAVFTNDGNGVRGNLAAVVKAILLDSEARGDTASSANFGKLMEPAEYAVSIMRMINGASDGVALINPIANEGQSLFTPPSVFNYYPPGYPVPGSTLVSPQFGIVNTGTTLNRVGLADSLIYGKAVAADPSIPGSIGTSVDLSAFEAIAGDAPTLVARLNTLMVHGALSTTDQNTIVAAVNSIAATDTTDRAKMGIFLVATSAAFQVKN
jgi:uncharacterized protein (DUF1800 family)